MDYPLLITHNERWHHNNLGVFATVAYYKLPWRSEYCRDCGGRATTKWPMCSCENHSPKPTCRLLPSSERLFCEHCGTEEPGKGICRLCGEYPIDLSQMGNIRLAGGRVPAVIAVPAIIVMSCVVGFLSSSKPLAEPRHWTQGAVFVAFIVVPLALLARWQRTRDLRAAREDFVSRHGRDVSKATPSPPPTPQSGF